uniref:Uncharacterized protein n=1 Tax=Anguilla anguilla TaxID=7936 RepID=A0A0E9QFT1_ANGAN
MSCTHIVQFTHWSFSLHLIIELNSTLTQQDIV